MRTSRSCGGVARAGPRRATSDPSSCRSTRHSTSSPPRASSGSVLNLQSVTKRANSSSGRAEIIPFRIRDWVESARCCAGGRSMPRQGSFAEAEYAGKKKQTRRDKFLAEMEQAVPWPRLVARLAPLYPKGEPGRPPIPLERMLRVYFVQQWYGLGDEAVEDAFYDSQALRGFAGILLNCDPVPDGTTFLHFRPLLQRT